MVALFRSRKEDESEHIFAAGGESFSAGYLQGVDQSAAPQNVKGVSDGGEESIEG
jgi:hypothetical protein